MMGVRIDRIKVNRGGPLGSDFELEPGDLNLIYGHNETGKTYIVESIINLLFRTGSRSPAKWNLRDWDLGGRIIVSGLGDEPVRFTKTGRKKLDDYWEEQAGLPKDLSRLLVVRAGEAVLVEEEEDGVGRSILKDYLSGEGLLDKIAARISKTLQGTSVETRVIVGDKMGEVRKRADCKESLDSLNALLNDVEEGYASGEACSLQQKREAIETELKTLKKAKRYHAARLHKKRKALQLERKGLPAEEKLSELESDISVYESKNAEVERKSSTLKKLEGVSEDYRWTEKALSVYQGIMGGQAVTRPKSVYMFFALVFLAGALVTGLLRLSIPLVLCAIGSVAFFFIYYMETQNALATAGDSRELENLKAQFKNRFGTELSDMAALEVQTERLKEDYIRANGLRKDLEEELIPDTKTHESDIKATLKVFMGTEPSPQEWRGTISALRSNINGLEDQTNSLDRELVSLDVPEEEYLDEHPGAEWDAERYGALEGERAETEKALDGEMKKLELLKTRIAQETGSESTEWEDLITELRDKREQTAEEYREITAQILAKVQVTTAIEEFREQENTRIAEGLTKQELTKPLRSLTGRYDRIKQEEDSGLVLVTGEYEEYPLAEISTGAREQIFLALRMGFASIAMEGQTAFLILDDAFQHSDWDRRKNLIAETLSLVKTGWQVFYFAMDDHIRDLFLEAGGALGDRFRSLELC